MKLANPLHNPTIGIIASVLYFLLLFGPIDYLAASHENRIGPFVGASIFLVALLVVGLYLFKTIKYKVFLSICLTINILYILLATADLLFQLLFQ